MRKTNLLKQHPLVAIVILNWNGKKYLEQFLPSVLASTYANFELVVADNGSTDQSLEFLQSNYPGIRLIRFPVNHGFTRGYNLAIEQLQTQINAPYYILLNSDVEVSPGWIEPMVGLLESDNRISACQPKLRSFYQRDQFEYAGAAGGWIDRYGYPFSRGRIFEIIESDHGQYDRPEPIFWASGAALFIRSEVYQQHHGFDEFFFAHMEEIDLCWRIQSGGGLVYACPASVVYHVGGGTLPRGNPRKTFLNFRNNHIMLWKNLHTAQKLWVIPVRLLLDWASAVKSLLAGQAGDCWAILRAHLAVIGWFFSKDRNKFRAPRTGIDGRPLTSIRGRFKGNIAWQHFARHKNKFSEIVPDTH